MGVRRLPQHAPRAPQGGDDDDDNDDGVDTLADDEEENEEECAEESVGNESDDGDENVLPMGVMCVIDFHNMLHGHHEEEMMATMTMSALSPMTRGRMTGRASTRRAMTATKTCS